MAYCTYWSPVADGEICHAATVHIRRLGEDIKPGLEKEFGIEF